MKMNDKNKIIYDPLHPKHTLDPRGLGVLFFERMQLYADKIAQIDAETGKTMTYSEMRLESVRVAQNMKKMFNLQADDIICLCTYNHLEVSLPYFASLFLGNRLASLDPTLDRADMRHLLNLVTPRLIFCGPESVHSIENVIKELNLNSTLIVFDDKTTHIPFSKLLLTTGIENEFRPKPVNCLEDTAIIFFSSGTTGLAKGICSTHYGIMTQQSVLAEDCDVSVVLYFTTFYWISAVMLTTMSIITGGTRIVCGRFDETKTMEAIEKYKVTNSFMSPFLLFKLTSKFKSDDYDTSSFKQLMIGGGNVTKEQMLEVRKLFPNSNANLCYGMTEASGCLTFFNINRDKHLFCDDKKILCSGRNIPGLYYKVEDPDTGALCGPNELGEICFKGERPLIKGYHKMDNSNTYDKDGFVHTGDIGYYDEDRCFYVIDRIKELIKYQSWHVIPLELEYILLSHPDVQDACVVGKPHLTDGEHPTAFVIVKSHAKASTLQDIMTFYDEKISGYDRKKLRGGINIIDNIPRTPSGKIKKRQMRELL